MDTRITETPNSMTINISPDARVYSPHVRVLKEFIEELSKLEQAVAEQRKPELDTDGFGPIESSIELADYVSAEIERVRKAAGTMLSDDFLLIVDGKRLPGQAREIG